MGFLAQVGARRLLPVPCGQAAPRKHPIVVMSPERGHTDAPPVKTYCPSRQQLQGLPRPQRAALLSALLFPGWQHPKAGGDRYGYPDPPGHFSPKKTTIG